MKDSIMIRDYRARQLNRAIYTVAIQPGYLNFLHATPSDVRGGNLPPVLAKPADLDFLDPTNPFFCTNRVLFSGGPHLAGNSASSALFRSREGVTILGDSGGYQLIAAPDLFQGDASRDRMLKWLEANADEAMTLDIPTAAISSDAPWTTFDDALEVTRDNLAYFSANRTPGKVRFLNAQQGRDRQEGLRWYEATKKYGFEGWAFGGTMKLRVLHLVEILSKMHSDDVLAKTQNRIHVLGASTLKAAVVLSAIQRGLRGLTGDEEFQITFDTSNPSTRMAMGEAYGYPLFGPASFDLAKFKPPSSYLHANSTIPFPIKSSAISTQLTIGDLNSICSATRQSGWDPLANLMLTNHNLDSILAGIDDANSIAEIAIAQAESVSVRQPLQLIPVELARLCAAVEQAFSKPDPVSFLRAYGSDIKAMGF